MRLDQTSLSLIAVLAFSLGCEESNSPPTAQRLPVAPSQTPISEAAPGAPSLVQAPSPQATAPNTTPEVPSSAPNSGSLGAAAFLTANAQVLATSEELLELLNSIQDETSAQAAAPRIAQLTQQWKVQATAATTLYLTLTDEQQNAVMQQGQQEAMAQAKSKPNSRGGNAIVEIQRIATSSAAPAIIHELTALRDTWLTTKGIYSPVTTRRRIEQELGPVGSPLKAQ